MPETQGVDGHARSVGVCALHPGSSVEKCRPSCSSASGLVREGVTEPVAPARAQHPYASCPGEKACETQGDRDCTGNKAQRRGMNGCVTNSWSLLAGRVRRLIGGIRCVGSTRVGRENEEG